MAGLNSDGIYLDKNGTFPTPPTDKIIIYVDSLGNIKAKFDTGIIVSLDSPDFTSDVAAISGGVDTNAANIATIQGDYVDLTSTQSISGNKIFTNAVVGVDPINSQHFATKSYVDSVSGGGGGNVSGPNVSSDNEVTVFNGITGKVLKTSGVKYSNMFGFLLESQSVSISGNTTIISGGYYSITGADATITLPPWSSDTLIALRGETYAGPIATYTIVPDSGSEPLKFSPQIFTTNEVIVLQATTDFGGAIWERVYRNDYPTITDHGLLNGLGDDDHPQYLLASGSREISGSLIPSTSGTFDLGTLTQPFKDLYLTGNSLYLGSDILSTSGSNLLFNDTVINNNSLITDTINLSGSTNTAWTSGASPEVNQWQSITYGNGLFVAVSATGTNRVMTSPDGITWTSRVAAEANSWQSVTYGNGIFVAVSIDGTNRVMTSPDGITWTSRVAAEANFWRSIIYGNGIFVAVSANGTNRVMTSPDGITWTSRVAAEANPWPSVTYGNGLYVAVTYSGTNRVMTSPDGITWTSRVAAEANQWESVTYGNGLYVAISSSGTNWVMTSPDGITWTSRVAAENNSWKTITYGNGLYVAIAQSGVNKVMYSPDGITWKSESATESTTWRSVIYGNGIFVAVSFGGFQQIMKSPMTLLKATTNKNTFYTLEDANDDYIALLPQSATNEDRVYFYGSDQLTKIVTIKTETLKTTDSDMFYKIANKEYAEFEYYNSNWRIINKKGNIYVEATSTAGQSLTASVTDMQFENIISNTHQSFNGTLFLAPRSGKYIIIAGCAFTLAITNYVEIYVGSSIKGIGNETSKSNTGSQGTIELTLNAGDAVYIRNANTGNRDTDPNRNKIFILEA